MAGREVWARRFLAAAIAAAIPAAAPGTTFKQPGFSESAVFSGLFLPTAVRFLPDGRVLVAEKSGRIKLFENLSDSTPEVVADLTTQVHNFWDRGLLGLAVDPDFAENGFVYVLYTHDAYIGGTAPLWGPGDGVSDPCPTPPGATTDGCVVSGRLSRLTAEGADWAASEQVLIEDWCQQFPSHSVGSLAFGADGYLYLSAGEGASFLNQDWGQFGGTLGLPRVTPANPCGDPPFPVGTPQTKPTAEGGALRSQSPRRAPGEPRVLGGSILRVDKATGLAAPDNPFVLAGSLDVNERRIVGYGLRNPFRIAMRPGTNDLWIADVGWGSWEELDRIADLGSVRNFGWPCREGSFTQYFGLDICPTAEQTAPAFFMYHHSQPAAADDGCPTGGSSIAGLAFHTGGDGDGYPPAYDGALFLSDYTRRCLWVMFPGEGGVPDPATIAPFASDAPGPVDIQIGPDGNAYYVSFDSGRILRISHGIHAVASANPTSGPVPLSVQFDSTGSTAADPGDALSFAWDLDGDGDFDDSTEPQPLRVYEELGTFAVRLRVSDGHGGFDVSAPVTISAGNEAPTATIASPASSLTWKVGDVVAFAGSATDPQDGDLPPEALSWDIVLHHCPSTCHPHVLESFAGVASGAFTAPDHEYPAYLEIRLTAVDSGGLSSTANVHVNPQTVALFFASEPPGLLLSSGALTQPAPFTQTVIVNSQVTIAAPSPQGSYPVLWEFASWSDGGAQSHAITAPADPASFTAAFAVHADLSLAAVALPETVCAGLPVTWTLDVGNAGPSRAAGVSAVATLPPGAELVSAEGEGWSCNGTAIVLCARPFLDIGAAPPIRIVAAPGSPGTAMLAATVGSTTSDIFGSDNSAQAAVEVQPGVARPEIAAPEWAEVGATGLTASVESHAGATWAWSLEGGTITAGQGTNAVTFDAGSPGTAMRLEVSETLPPCTSPAASGIVQVDFLDVPPGHLFHDFVVDLSRAQVTAGCGGGNYCPADSVTRAQLAVFLLKSRYGAGHAPPPATGGVFADVSAGDPFAPWIEELAALGITGGCGGGNYCPQAAVPRAQMAVFLLKSLLGADYDPPPAAGVFGDVPAADPFAPWIEDLYARGITGGCQAVPLLYCPGNPNTRGQMSVFLVLTFGL